MQKRIQSDEFAKELADLWFGRKMKGVIYTAWLYSMPVGFIFLEHSHPYACTIRGTWVDPNFRGKGVGEFLLKKVLADTPKQDIIVNVTKGAEGFYEKYGFLKMGHRDDFDMDIYYFIR